MIDASRLTTLMPGDSVTVCVLPECPPYEDCDLVLFWRVAHLDLVERDGGDDAVFFDADGAPSLLTGWEGIGWAYSEECGVCTLDFHMGHEHLWLVPDAD